MTDNAHRNIEIINTKPIGKLERATGGLNIALGVVLFVDAIIIGIVAVCCLLMSFSLFFMAAIPAFFVTGFLCFMAFGAGIVNVVTGLASVLASPKRAKLHTVFSIVAIVLDIAVIPANIIVLICGGYLLSTEIDYMSVFVFLIAACAIVLAIASLILSIIRIVKRNNAPKIGGNN